MRNKYLLCIIFFYCVFTSLASAHDAIMLSTEKEKEARLLFKELRCMTCQGQSLDESHATLAVEMRHLIRQKIHDGLSPKDIKLFLQERYGTFILLSPPLNEETFFLWFSPFILLVIGAAVIFRYFKQAA